MLRSRDKHVGGPMFQEKSHAWACGMTQDPTQLFHALANLNLLRTYLFLCNFAHQVSSSSCNFHSNNTLPDSSSSRNQDSSLHSIFDFYSTPTSWPKFKVQATQTSTPLALLPTVPTEMPLSRMQRTQLLTVRYVQLPTTSVPGQGSSFEEFVELKLDLAPQQTELHTCHTSATYQQHCPMHSLMIRLLTFSIV